MPARRVSKPASSTRSLGYQTSRSSYSGPTRMRKMPVTAASLGIVSHGRVAAQFVAEWRVDRVADAGQDMDRRQSGETEGRGLEIEFGAVHAVPAGEAPPGAEPIEICEEWSRYIGGQPIAQNRPTVPDANRERGLGDALAQEQGIGERGCDASGEEPFERRSPAAHFAVGDVAAIAPGSRAHMDISLRHESAPLS